MRLALTCRGVACKAVQLLAHSPAWPAAFAVQRKNLTPVTASSVVSQQLGV
jgi:hypothetical protein